MLELARATFVNMQADPRLARPVLCIKRRLLRESRERLSIIRSASAKEYAISARGFPGPARRTGRILHNDRLLADLDRPGSNDGSFEPNRSVLAASATADERAEFTRKFEEVRATEEVSPRGAITAYRLLVRQHPEFAESHYRLARLLAANGDLGRGRSSLRAGS